MSTSRYFYGNPNNDFDDYQQAMQTFSLHESLNSAKTSSLPLAQFWRPNGLEDRINHIRGQKADEVRWALREPAKRCFEYPTSLPKNCGKGKPSMTDLMLLSDSYKIAIEAKYTEYLESGLEYRPHVGDWRKDNPQNRAKVLSGWLNLVGARIECDTSILDDIPYQLIHRIASACSNVVQEKPIVIYHLFYDNDSYQSAYHFAEKLKKWATDLKLNGIGFHVLLTKIVLSPIASKYEDENKLNLIFKHIRTKNFYGNLMETELISL